MTYYRSKKNVLKVAVGLKGNAETLPQVFFFQLHYLILNRLKYTTQIKTTAML